MSLFLLFLNNFFKIFDLPSSARYLAKISTTSFLFNSIALSNAALTISVTLSPCSPLSKPRHSWTATDSPFSTLDIRTLFKNLKSGFTTSKSLLFSRLNPLFIVSNKALYNFSSPDNTTCSNGNLPLSFLLFSSSITSSSVNVIHSNFFIRLTNNRDSPLLCIKFPFMKLSSLAITSTKYLKYLIKGSI